MAVSAYKHELELALVGRTKYERLRNALGSRRRGGSRR
jgi:hypothetical protein